MVAAWAAVPGTGQLGCVECAHQKAASLLPPL